VLVPRPPLNRGRWAAHSDPEAVHEMAKNDVVLMDAIVDDRLREVYPSNQRDEVFEFLAFEQVLKDFDLSREEIEAGWVDGWDDGCIDAFFIFVNGHLLCCGLLEMDT
jgi:hypothetical protein